ncbi:MAG: sulfatase [Candidatus Nanohaloarchaea archaeon]
MAGVPTGGARNKSLVHVVTQLDRVDGNWVIHDKNNELTQLNKSDISYIRGLYDAGFYHTDRQVGSFFDYLKKQHMYKKSIIIVTSSHGEVLVERQVPKGRYIGHGNPYMEVVHVSFIIKFPGVGHRVIDKQVQTFDLFPTILDYTDIDQNSTLKQRIQGKSLMPLIDGKSDRKYFDYHAYSMEPLTVITPHWGYTRRYHLPDPKQLFNLTADPLEKHNVAQKNPEVAKRLEKKLLRWRFDNWALGNRIYR